MGTVSGRRKQSLSHSPVREPRERPFAGGLRTDATAEMDAAYAALAVRQEGFDKVDVLAWCNGHLAANRSEPQPLARIAVVTSATESMRPPTSVYAA